MKFPSPTQFIMTGVIVIAWLAIVNRVQALKDVVNG